MSDLDARRWEEATLLFDGALSRPEGERAAFLTAACSDPELRRLVDALLRADATPAAVLLASPATLAEVARAAGPDEADGIEELAEAPGRMVGPWRIVRELGRGGMGVVYLAERADDEYRKLVALKLVKRGMDTDEILRRFRRERQILASLEHANIARLHDGGAAGDGRPYLVMEYVDGTRIDRYCDDRGLDTAARLRLVVLVCRAAHHAHTHRVVHRDIKPSNILVSAAGDVRLLDFGVALMLDDEPGATAPRTATGRGVMTPAYASPEQLSGGAVTAAADVYAIGVLLHELLTGVRPSALGGARGSGEGPRGRRIHRDLEAIVATATAPAAAARYSSAGAFADDIERHLAGRPIAASGAWLRRRRLASPARRGAGIAASILVIAALLVLAWGWAPWAVAPPSGVRSLAVVPAGLPGGDSADAYLVQGLADELASRLGRLRRLRVKSPRAVSATAASRSGPVALGRLLGVDYLVESTIRRSDTLLDVSVSLVDTRDGFQLWADGYSATPAGLMALQDSIVGDIAAAVAGRLSADERAMLEAKPSASPIAYDHYLRANYHLQRRTPASIRAAIGEYEIALSHDPRFAEALARSAYAYLIYRDWSWSYPGRTSADLMTTAASLADRAIEVDPRLAAAWVAQAYRRVLEDPARHAGALAAFERSLGHDSLNPEAYHQYGQTLMVLGRDREAIAAYHRALALEPGRPMTLVPIGAIHSNAGQPDAAARWLDSALVAAGSVPAPYALAVWAEFTLRKGDAGRAAAAAGRALEMDASYATPGRAVLAMAQTRLGDPDAPATLARALAEIDTLAPSPTDVRFVAPALLAAGRRADALTLLERARPRGAQLWFYLRSPAFDAVRTEPRFAALWRATDPRPAPAPGR